MSDKPLQTDDEIDLFDLFLTLWESKWLIALFVTVSFFIGVALTQPSPKEYNVKAPYLVHHSFDKGLVEKTLLAVMGPDWRKEANGEIGDYLTLATATETPLNSEEFKHILSKAEKEVAKLLLMRSKLDISIIEKFDEPLLNTDSAAAQSLAANRIVSQIEQLGFEPISLQNTMFELVKPRTPLVLALSLVLGGFLGSAFVLVRRAIISRTIVRN